MCTLTLLCSLTMVSSSPSSLGSDGDVLRVVIRDIKHDDYSIDPEEEKEVELVGKGGIKETVRAKKRPSLFSKDFKVKLPKPLHLTVGELLRVQLLGAASIRGAGEGVDALLLHRPPPLGPLLHGAPQRVPRPWQNGHHCDVN